jgi:hypothetical protein
MNYILAHWSEIITALTTLIIFARIIVKLTPTPKDDTALDAFVDCLKHLGLVIQEKAQIILVCLCLLSLTSCAGLTAFIASPLGQASIVTAEALGKQLASAAEESVVAQVILKAHAQIAVLNARGIQSDTAQEIVRQSEILGLAAVVIAAQQQYAGMAGHPYVFPLAVVTSSK